MFLGRFSVFRVIIIAVLSVMIITSAVIVWTRYQPADEISILPAQAAIWNSTIFIDGNVHLPGYYPCTETDTLQSIIDTAGGLSGSADNLRFTLTVQPTEENSQSQKIDINRADTWLLQALPGIGETLAGRILDYRTENGMFRNTLEIMQVEGIGPVVYEKIEPFITVSEQ